MSAEVGDENHIPGLIAAGRQRSFTVRRKSNAEDHLIREIRHFDRSATGQFLQPQIGALGASKKNAVSFTVPQHGTALSRKRYGRESLHDLTVIKSHDSQAERAQG